MSKLIDDNLDSQLAKEVSEFYPEGTDKRVKDLDYETFKTCWFKFSLEKKDKDAPKI